MAASFRGLTMARNRKHQPATIRFGPAVKAFVLCALIGGSGVGYVWQKSQIVELDRQIKKREVRLRDLEQQNEKMKKQLATLRSPQYLDTRVRELNLGLTTPQPSQVLRLPEPVTEPGPPGGGSQYAQQGTAAVTP
jgi:cell division protein FtsB